MILQIELPIPYDINKCAEELTRIELELLSHLGAPEFINVFARENNSSHSQFGRISNENNILAKIFEARTRASKKTHKYDSYIKWFNRLSYLVATTICKVINFINQSID